MPSFAPKVSISSGKLSFRKKSKKHDGDTSDSTTEAQKNRIARWLTKRKKQPTTTSTPFILHHDSRQRTVIESFAENSQATSPIDTAAIVDHLTRYIDKIVEDRCQLLFAEDSTSTPTPPSSSDQGESSHLEAPSIGSETTEVPPAYRSPLPRPVPQPSSSISARYQDAVQYNRSLGAQRFYEAQRAVLEHHLKQPDPNLEAFVFRSRFVHSGSPSTDHAYQTEEKPSLETPYTSEPSLASSGTTLIPEHCLPAVEETRKDRYIQNASRALRSFWSIFLNVVVFHILLLRIPVTYAISIQKLSERHNPTSSDSNQSMFTYDWLEFINQRSLEWKTITGLAAVISSAVLTLLQVSDAGANAVTRATALTCFMCCLCSLLSAGSLLFRYRNVVSEVLPCWMKRETWDKSITKRCKPFVSIAFPVAAIVWSLVFFLISMLSFIWQPIPDDQDPSKDTNPLSIPERAGLTIVCGACFVILGLVIRGYSGIATQRRSQRIPA